MQVAMTCEFARKPCQSSLVGSETKNPHPISASDMIGLSWILLDSKEEY